MKRCAKCGQEKEVGEFYVILGRIGRLCKTCNKIACSEYRKNNREKVAASNRAYRLAHPEWAKAKGRKSYQRNRQAYLDRVSKYREQNPEKKHAHNLIGSAKLLGKLSPPKYCEQCGAEAKVDAHHDDYSKPIEVRWLCKFCHRKVHAA